MGRDKRMNRYYYDSVLRMSVEMSLFMMPDGFTINDMSELLKLDKSIIREDVYNFFIFDVVNELFRISEDDDSSEYFDLNDYFNGVDFENYNVEEDIKSDQEMDDEEETDEMKLHRYITSYRNLSDFQNIIKKIEVRNMSSYEKKDCIFNELKKVCIDIPREFDPQKCWKNDFISQLKVAEIDEDWEKLIKSLENAKTRILRRIKGTTESGVRKGMHKDGEKYGLLSGLYDDTKFNINAKFLDYDNDMSEYMLALSSEEYTHLNEILEKQGKTLQKMDGLFKVKNSLEIIQPETDVTFDVLDKINEGKCIKFEYTNKKKGTTDWVKIKPEWINYNSDTGFMYIVDADGYKYKVDRIKGLRVYDLEAGEKVDKKPKIKKEWVDVVIHIPKIEGYDNLIYKIKDDVRKRNMDPSYNVDDHFSEDESKYIYRDRIEKGDMGNFKSWIYSYGSSFIVMEPKNLRQQVIDSYKASAEYY